MSEVFANLVEFYEDEQISNDILNKQLLLDSYSDRKLQELLYVESIHIIEKMLFRIYNRISYESKVISKHDLSSCLIEKLIWEWNRNHDDNDRLHINKTTHICNDGTEPLLSMKDCKMNISTWSIVSETLSDHIENAHSFQLVCGKDYGQEHVVTWKKLSPSNYLEKNDYVYDELFIHMLLIHPNDGSDIFDWSETGNVLIPKADEDDDLYIGWTETAAIMYYFDHENDYPLKISTEYISCDSCWNDHIQYKLNFIPRNDDEKLENLKQGYIEIKFSEPILDLKCCLRKNYIGSLSSDTLKIAYHDIENATESLIDYLNDRINDEELLYEHTKRELELERIYHHISDLKKYECTLISNIETLERRENALKESIGIRTSNLKRLENETMTKTSELDMLDQRLKDLTFATQTNAYIEENYSRIQDEIQKFNQKVTMVDYYNKHYKAFQGYRAAYIHFDAFANKLDEKRSSLKAKKKDHSLRYCERLNDLSKTFEQKKHEFDKYKTEMESKFKDHQHKIDTYDDVVGERDKYLKEMNDLREQLETMTSERDKYKITVETMMQYRQ